MIFPQRKFTLLDLPSKDFSSNGRFARVRVRVVDRLPKESLLYIFIYLFEFFNVGMMHSYENTNLIQQIPKKKKKNNNNNKKKTRKTIDTSEIDFCFNSLNARGLSTSFIES